MTSPTSQRNGKFSVAVPCYNYGHYLPGCIESIVTQRDIEVDVLIIDDTSTDDSLEVARSLAATFPQVEVLAHDVNKRHIATFNDGVDWATNEYFLLISADDMLAPGALARARDVFIANPDVGLVYGGVRDFHPTPPPVDDIASPAHHVWSGPAWISRCARLGDNPTYSPEVMLRTSVQHEIGGYDPRCGHTSDMNMWLRAAAVADVAYLQGCTQAFYRVHGDNMSRTTFSEKRLQIEHRWDAFEAFFDRPGPGRTDTDRRLAASSIATWSMWEGSKAFERGEVDSAGLDDYVELAARVDPGHRRRLAYWGLQLRRRLGPKVARVFPPFIGARAVRFARRMWRERSLRERGA